MATVASPSPRLRLEPISRWRAFHMGPALALFVWGTVLLFAMVFVPEREGMVLCHFKGLTGLACPTCGGMRQAAHLAQGDLWSAFTMNPMLLVAGVVVLAVLVLRIGFGRRIVLSLSDEGRRQLWLWGGALFLANWLYVITWVG